MRVFKDVLKRNMSAVILWLVFSAVTVVVLLLYNVMREPFYYASALSLFFLIIFLIVECIKEKKREKERGYAIASIKSDWRNLPEAHSDAEKDYQEMVRVLGMQLEELIAEYGKERQDALDYYSAWVHQIKTPIAVIKLKIADDTPENRALSAELFRIEQYVDMVLQYIRLGSETNDLVIREYSLDELVKETVRKYAPQFVGKKLRLDYVPVDRKIVTDRKWFTCILEQLISNAIKYTPSGSVSIMINEKSLSVSDTGIGIAAEDLPRIFEKGFTGGNGRIGEKSSGLGLYLAKKAANLLAIPLLVESTVGQGSTFTLDLSHKN